MYFEGQLKPHGCRVEKFTYSKHLHIFSKNLISFGSGKIVATRFFHTHAIGESRSFTLPIQMKRPPQIRPFPWRRYSKGIFTRGLQPAFDAEDGDEFHLLLNAGPLHGEKGLVVGAVVALMDITERKRTEEAHQESEARFRSLFESMTEGVALHELLCDDQGQAVDYRIVSANPAFEKHTGLKPEQIHGQLASIAYGTGEAPYLEEYARVAQTGQAYVFETLFPPMQRHFHISVTSPTQGQFVTVFEDITERQRAKEALQRSYQRLNLLADTASQLLASVSPQQVVDAICRKVMEFLHCDSFFNFLLDGEEGRLRLNACAGIPEEEARRIEWLDYGVAVCGCAARDFSRIVAEDILITDDMRTELVKSYGIQAYACHPLLVEGRVLGTLSFGTRSRSRFTDDELMLMKAVADQVAIAMDRKLAEEKLHRLNEKLEQRVKDRTKELRETVAQLQEEVTERQRAEEAVRESEAKLRRLTERVLSLQEKERQQLSWELHEDLAQYITALKLELRGFEPKLPKGDEKLQQDYRQALNKINVVVNKLRLRARDLSPQLLTNLGLTVSLRACARISRIHGLECNLHLDELSQFFDAADQISIYRVFEEAFGNIVQHADATKVTLAAKTKDDEVEFLVEDNGQGFDPDIEEACQGVGQSAMAERVRALGGAFKLESQIAVGTRILFTIPRTGK